MKDKYLKYKSKYLELKKQMELSGGTNVVGVANLLNYIYTHCNNFFTSSNYNLFHDLTRVTSTGYSWTYFYFQSNNFQNLNIKFFEMLKAIALRNYINDINYSAKINILVNVIDAVTLYFKCFVSRFGKNIMNQVYSSYSNYKDIPIKELCLLPYRLFMNQNDFITWKCYHSSNPYSFNIYQLPQVYNLNFLPCYPKTYKPLSLQQNNDSSDSEDYDDSPKKPRRRKKSKKPSKRKKSKKASKRKKSNKKKSKRKKKMRGGKRNCGCGQDPCITYGAQNNNLTGGKRNCGCGQDPCISISD